VNIENAIVFPEASEKRLIASIRRSTFLIIIITIIIIIITQLVTRHFVNHKKVLNRRRKLAFSFLKRLNCGINRPMVHNVSFYCLLLTNADSENICFGLSNCGCFPSILYNISFNLG